MSSHYHCSECDARVPNDESCRRCYPGDRFVAIEEYEALQQQCEKLVQQLESIKEVAARLYRDAVIEERVGEALAEYQAFKEKEK